MIPQRHIVPSVTPASPASLKKISQEARAVSCWHLQMPQILFALIIFASCQLRRYSSG